MQYSSRYDLESYCTNIKSVKVLERRKSAEGLYALLDSDQVFTLIKGGKYPEWKDVINSIHCYLLKEAEKLNDDERKKSKTGINPNVDLLFLAVRNANKGVLRLNLDDLLKPILNIFTSILLKKYYAIKYLQILNECILSEPRYHGQITSEQWIEILDILKNTKNFLDTTVLQCFKLVIKWGPLNRLPLYNLRNEFDFITNLCQKTEQSFSRCQQTELLEILINFCVQNSSDCCLACCKLGEYVFKSLRHLYQPALTNNLIKNLLYEFFLLQVKLHHPKGVFERDRMAYAFSWNEWRKQLASMYHIILEEIKYQLRCSLRSTFLCSDSRSTKNIFVSLCIEVFRQVFNSGLLNNSQATDKNEADGEPPPPKRYCVEISFQQVLGTIQQHKSWQWLYIMTEYLRKYPYPIGIENVYDLLEVISNILSEKQDLETIKHCYKCLDVILDVEQYIDDIPNVDRFNRVWLMMWESALRHVGLNYNIEATHKLIQKMIVRKKYVKDVDEIFQIFFSGVVLVTPSSVKTLHIAANYYGMPAIMNNVSYRQTIIKWLLANNGDRNEVPDAYLDDITSEILIKMCFKQWPRYLESNPNDGSKYETFENVYEYNSFKKLIILQKKVVEDILDKATLVNEEVFNYLMECLEDLGQVAVTSNNSSHLNDLVKRISLSGDILFKISKYRLICNLQTCLDKMKIKNMFVMLTDSVLVYKEDMENLTCFKKVLWKLNDLLSKEFDCQISNVFRSLLSVQTLSCFFDIRNCEEDKDNDYTGDLKMLSVKILSNFCLHPSSNELTETQKHALESLIKYEYNFNNTVDCHMACTFLRQVGRCRTSIIGDDVLKDLFKLLANLCEVRGSQYDMILEILEVFEGFIKHINFSENSDLKSSYINLLSIFYNVKDGYGYKVSLTLLKCIGCLIKLNIDDAWNLYEINWVIYLPNFLTSNYQEVRLEVIKYLIMVFEMNGLDNDSVFKMQKELFIAINRKSQEVFRIEANVINQERSMDETVGRTSSVLHTYASLIISNSMWRKKFLYFLIRLVDDKKIDKDSLHRILDLIARELKFPDVKAFLSFYSDYILREWNEVGKNFSEFPYDILYFSSELEFYEKQAKVIVPLLIIKEDENAIQKICKLLKKSRAEVYELYFVEIMGIVLPHLTNNSTAAKNTYNDIMNLLSASPVLGYFEHIDGIITYAAERVADKEQFIEQFDMPYKLLQEKEDYTASCFNKIISLLEEKMKIEVSLLEHCALYYPNKLQSILLNLYLNIYEKSTDEDKLKSLHQYATFVNLLLNNVTTTEDIHFYLVRSVVYALLHFICNGNDSIFTVASAVYLKKFCIKVARTKPSMLVDHLSVIVNRVIPFTSRENALSKECLCLLRSIIVDNTHNFKQAIRNLDRFPLTDQLDDINRVYNEIRSEIVTGDLENEIKHFLQAGKLECNIGSRANALKHLKTLLNKQKDELKELYEKSKDIKGYTKDSENSTLHNLICMLVKLCTSSDNMVSVEAARCLGEIGPLDLATLILQPRKPHRFFASTAFELLIACAIDLFLTYLTDQSARVVRASSKALYDVLNSKEGKHYVATINDAENVKRSYLYPFVPHQEFKSASVVQLIKDKMLKNVDNGEIWWPQNDHDSWIIQLTSKLLESFVNKSFLQKLVPICGIKVAFCEKILPHLVYVIVDIKDKTYTDVMVKQINSFFENVWSVISMNPNLDSYRKMSIQCMLNVIDFLRLNYRDTDQLQLNYLKIARTACYCSNYFAALLYIELWSKRTRTVNPGGESILENICQNEDPEVSNAVQTILKQSYCALGDLDALYGCNFSHIVDPDRRVEYFKQFDKWDRALMYYDTQVSSGHNDRRPELVNSLKNCGLYHLATNYDNVEIDYECMWRLCQFDGDNSKGNPIDLYEMHKYESLKYLRERHRELFCVSIEKARQSVIDNIKNLSLENTKTLYACLTQLQSIEELEEASEVSRDSDYKDLLVMWQKQDKIDKVDFKSVEPVKAQRITILQSLIDCGASELKGTLVKSYLDLAGTARTDGYFNVAMRTISNLHPITQNSSEYDYWKTFEEAQIHWSMNEKTLARYLIKHLLKINENDVRLKFAALKLYGTWMAETHSENPQAILNNYFLEPLKMMRNVTHSDEDKENICQAYDVIARFSDSEYQRILSYMKSDEFERKMKNMEKSKETADKIKLLKRKDRDEQKAATIYKKQSLIDEAEIENTRKEKDVYFILAIKYYLLSLQYSDVNNIRAFRILSLWLENRTTKNLKELLDTLLPKIPSHKFVSILPQLAPHLTNNNDEFSNHVMNIIERCCIDHPHHTLPIIKALANSNKDAEYSQTPFKKESNEARVLGALLLLNKLKKRPDLKDIIREMEMVCDALIEFAYTKLETCQEIVKRKKRGEQEKQIFVVPTNLKLRAIKNFSFCLLPTCTLPIAKNYDDVISICSYSNEFETVGGINCPKKIYCRGTDGIMRTQLLKGQDDLRQDAVMEQVFSNLNELLHANNHTKHLLIRTYKVVPLSKRSGVLEWVDSIRIGDYLVSAHPKYNPKDWTTENCKKLMNSFKSKSTDDKLKKFKEICENFRPVFHKFFETNFPEPLMWYERRKAYMRSVATTSMCGYIVGLGDRHLHNILLDEVTAEVIHIDFGIAFEQGKVLPTPETVPFRLTRDIEDAMGVTGIEGVFRKSCEKTMEVMRKNSETIVTILEVLLYDPLYEWTISPAEAYSRQFSDTTVGCDRNSNGNDDDEIPVNMTAERALIRLKQKLQGTEEGGTTSIEGQVERLLQQARDPSNLCRLFSGWQPYL